MIAQNYYYPPLHLVFPSIQPPTQTMTLNDSNLLDRLKLEAATFKLSYSIHFQLLHPDSKLPTRATDGSAGLDLYSLETIPYGKEMIVHDTGVAVAIPEGYVGLVFPRSSISGTSLRLANCVGVVDCDYRGSIKLKFDILNYTDSERDYQPGDRIGQLLIVPCPRFSPVAVDELPATVRGHGGFGSSGR